METSQDSQDVLVQVQQDVMTITLNRPKAGNSISPQMGANIIQALKEAEEDPRIVGVVIRATGKVFCSGMDLRGAMNSSTNSEEKGSVGVNLFGALWEFTKPIISCLQGPVLGGGVAIFCASDVRIIENDKGWLQFPEVKRGIVPALVSTFALPTMGPRASRWLMTAERVSAETLESAGIAQRVNGSEGVDKEVEKVLNLFRSAAPKALSDTKRLVREVPFLSHAQAIEVALKAFAASVGGPEASEGIRSFLAREEPNWSTFRSKL